MPKVLNAQVWERSDNDWYVEPERVTAQLLKVEQFPGWTHDPCCGQGNIVNAFVRNGLICSGSDIVQRTSADWFLGYGDFLGEGPGLWGADNYVSNPPYYGAKGAERCIRRALALAPGKVAAFVDKRFTSGGRRAAGLYHHHPPSREYEVTPRPSCPPGAFLQAGGEAKGGRFDYVWLVWDAREARLPPGSMWQKGILR